jgi:DNA recombination protein RmuC
MQGLIGAIVAALAGVAIGFWLRSASAKAEKAQLAQRSLELSVELAAERERMRTESQARAEADRAQASAIARLEAELKAERQGLAEKLALLETAKQALANQFEALAGKILDEKSKTFSEGNQKELGSLLTPLQTQIENFRKKVEEAQSDSKTGVTKLETLIGFLGNLNQQLTTEAHNLTMALRGSAKTQGDWGEFILRDILEKAGLREGEQYTFQQPFAAVDEGNGENARAPRTDVILRFPGERSLVIDSKVSLKAYTDSVNAPEEEARKAALREHLKSVRGHISNLSKAGYHNLPGLHSPDFVVMFVPVESAFLFALQGDPDLWSDAYRQGVLLVGPTTLLYIIRIVNVLWDQEKQNRSVKEVMDQAADLYKKFAGFINDMEDLGKSLKGASDSYEEARRKLSVGPGNLVRQVEELKKLGVKPRFAKSTKPIPQKWLAASDPEWDGAESADDVDSPSEAVVESTEPE